MIRTVFVHEFVTGGGLAGEDLPPSWADEGRAMRRALAEDFASIPGVNVRMTLDARLPDEPGPWETIRVGPGEEPSAFDRLARESDWTLCIAPETGGILEQRARTINEVGGHSLGSSPSAIALCADKLRLAEHLRTVGVNTPPSIRVVPREGLPRDHRYPAVLKPIDGAGSMDTYLIEGPDNVPPEALLMREGLLQPFVNGRAMSASFLIQPTENGREQLVRIGRSDQRIVHEDGRFVYRGGVVPSRQTVDERAVIAAIRSVPGLAGWVGVDFVWDPARGRLCVLEINPRVTTSYVGFRRVGGVRNWIAAWWISLAIGTNPPAIEEPRTGPVAFLPDGRIEGEGS